MKIIFVYDSISPIGGGSQQAILTWIKNFEKFKIEYRLLTSYYSAKYLIKTKILKKEKMMIIQPSFNASFFLPKFYISPILTNYIKEQILKFKPDIIQVNEPSLLDFQIIEFANKNKIQVGSFFHTFYEKFSLLGHLLSFYQNYIFKNTDFILTPSFNTFQLIDKKYLNKKIFKVYYPVKKDFFDKPNFYKKNINNQKKTLIYIGRLSPEKKLYFILEILKLLPDNYQLKIIGDGVLRDKLKTQTIKNKLEEKVIFLGYLPASKIIKIIQKEPTLGVFPSSSETFGITYIECLACYLPLLVYDYCISREVIPDGCAIFLNIYDSKLWAKKIIEIFNKDLYFRMKENIKKNYNKIKFYNENLSTKKLIKTYHLILNQHQ